jgi:hypothetical protein
MQRMKNKNISKLEINDWQIKKDWNALHSLITGIHRG